MLIHRVGCLALLGFAHVSISSQDELAQHYAGSSLGHNAIDPSWSEVPSCSNSRSTSEEFCVYTNTEFANGRGISVIASSTQAQALLRLPAFTKPTILSSLGVNTLVSPPFYTVQLEGRGVGLVANRTIRQGEWLMSFTPAFMMTKDAITSMTRKDRLSLQRLALEQLPLPLQSSIYALYGQSDDAANDPVEDILNTNSFELPVEVKPEGDDEIYEVEYKVLFPEIARFNHACRPTADYIFDSSLLALHIIAFRDILPGEELTITYIDPLQKRQARQETLLKSWGFTCTCPVCSAPYKLTQASDARIDAITELQDELVDRTTRSKGSPDLAEKLISLLHQERLWTLVHDGYFTAAVEYSGVGDVKKTKEYAMLALQSRLLCRGAEFMDDWHRDMALLSTDPERHPSWKFRIPR